MAGADAAAATAAVVVVVDGGVVVVAAVVVVVGAELLAVLVDVIPPGAGLVLRQQDRGARATLSVARHLHTVRPGLLGVLLLLVSAEGVAQAQDVDDAERGGLARRPLVDVRVPGARCGEGDGPGVQTPAGHHLEAAAAAVKVARDD